jgi:molybdopterin molybdotransferase
VVQLSNDCFRGADRLMPLDEALALLAARIVAVTEIEDLPLDAAAGRILAADLTSARNVPPHDNSAVDGYALRFEDLHAAQATALEVIGRAAAGHPFDGEFKPASAVRIFTGAALPDGPCAPDTIVMQEDIELSADGAAVIVPPGLSLGANRRKCGEDVTAGSAILTAGRLLRPQDVGLAASVGIERISVFRRLRVAVFSTGDEVREPGSELDDGAIYDANRYVLKGLLKNLNVDITDLGILPDEFEAIREALAQASENHDAIITSGGVSVGEEDHVRPAVEALGSLHFWRLAIKPGRPVALGQVNGVAFIGLPGNPAAAMVTFLRFARPLILRLSGVTDVEPMIVKVSAAFEHKKKVGRREWVRASLQAATDGLPTAHKFPREGAGILSSMVASSGLVELPEEMTRVEPGTIVDFIPFSEVGA